MTNWHPPLESGLARGDRRVEDALRAHVESGDLADAHAPGVYALTLSTPDDRPYAEVWDEHHDARHPELDAMEAAGRVLYVGAAKNVFERVTEHLESPNRSGAVPRVFPIHDVQTVWWKESVEQAFTDESRHAIELRNLGGVYVSQN